jgi:hypothetical protein
MALRPRSELHEILTALCENVYFQPPANVQMKFPAIVYRRARTDTKFADDSPYAMTNQYEMTLISRDPDEPVFAALRKMPMCEHETSFPADNLNHDVFNIYF